MDLNELVIQEIIESQKEKMDFDFKKKLKIEISKREKEINDLHREKLDALNSDLVEKNEKR